MLRRFLLLALMLVLVVVALPFSLAQADCDFSYSNYARAVQLHDMGDYVRALLHYQCAQLEDPDDAIIPILIENVYEDIANAPSAWSRPESAAIPTACDPAIDHVQLGAQAHDTGDLNLALIHLHCALLADPTQVNALYRMGMIHIDRGETHEAKHYFDRADRAAAAQVEDEDLLLYLLGEDARSVLGEYALDELTLTSPEPVETGEYLPPGASYQRTVLRVVWTRQGQDRGEPRQADNGSAISPLEHALIQDPTRVDLRCELGRQYMAQGDYAAAYKHFSRLITERLGDYCVPATDGDESSALGTEPIVSKQPKPARVSAAEQIVAQAMSYMTAGNRYLAANTFLAALELDPLQHGARCRLGMIYTEWAHYRGALEHFDAILQQDPQNSCARQNRTIAARDMLTILTPLVVDDYFHYGRAYVRMGEWELARDAFLKGLEIDPTRHDARCELGMLHAQLGEDRAALEEFDLALFADDSDSCARSNRDALLQRLRDG